MIADVFPARDPLQTWAQMRFGGGVLRTRHDVIELVRIFVTAPRAFRRVVEFSLGGATHTARGPFVLHEITKEISNAGGKGTMTTTLGPLDFEPGQIVRVAFNPADPNEALVRTPGDALQAFSIQTFIGFMCIVVALLIFFYNGDLAWLGPEWHR